MRQRGFTLLEAAVALAVLAVVLAAATRAVGAAASVSEQFRLRLLAGWVAENRLALHRAEADWPDPGSAQGTSRQGERDFGWREEIRSTPNPRFRQIEVSVGEMGSDAVLARQTGFLVRAP